MSTAAPLPSGVNEADIDKENVPKAPPINDDIKELLDESDEPKLQKEFVDDIDVANNKISQFVEYLKESKYSVILSGAGISTNTKRLADFRGDKGLISNRPPLVQMGIAETKMDSIMPTFTHFCIKLLIQHGYFKKIITSNHDGLHNKTNVNNDDIVDLFGNVYVEKCRKCKTRYYRKTVVSHLYRKCDNYPKCKGKLKRTACNMGESVDAKQLQRAHDIADLSMLSLVLGSSMTIYPFCDLPPKAMKTEDNTDKIGYVLVTRQETNYDKHALLCIHMNVDHFMLKVMKELGLENECKQFIYSQVFDCNVIIQSNNDMIAFTLKSKQQNEGLPFIQSACVQILKNKDGDNDEEKKQNQDENENDDKYEVIKEYELQKMKDLNWIFEIMKSQFLDTLNKGKDYKIRIEIEWESGFEMKTNYKQLFENIDWNKNDEVQTMQMQLRKVVIYDI